MKKQFLAAALMAGAFALPAAAQNVAIVNGKAIPQSRLDALTAQIEAQAKRTGMPMPDEVKDQLREEVIAREVFMQEAERRGLQASPDFKEKMDLARQSVLINELFADYQAKHPVTEEEARTEYDRVVKAQAPEAGAKEYKASHILVETEDEAKKLIADLDKGAKFDELAKKESKDPGSGAQGGELGWATADTYVPEFGEALKGLKKGQTTKKPVKSQFGWHVIRLEDERAAKAPEPPKFDDVKDQIKEQIEQKKLAEFQQELREKAKVK